MLGTSLLETLGTNLLEMLGTNLLDYTRLHACTYNEHLVASCVRMLQTF